MKILESDRFVWWLGGHGSPPERVVVVDADLGEGEVQIAQTMDVDTVSVNDSRSGDRRRQRVRLFQGFGHSRQPATPEIMMMIGNYVVASEYAAEHSTMKDTTTGDGHARIAALDRLLEASLLINEDKERSLGEMGLTSSRVALLWRVHQAGPSTQKVLADALQVSPRNVTGLVDGLVATGFITRQAHPTDRRAALVTLTDKGRATASLLDRQQIEFADELFGGMTQHGLAEFVAGMDEVLTRLRTLIRSSGDPS